MKQHVLRTVISSFIAFVLSLLLCALAASHLFIPYDLQR